MSTEFVVQPVQSGQELFSPSITDNERKMEEHIRLLKKGGAELVDKVPPSVRRIEKLVTPMIAKPGSTLPEIVVREGYDFSHINGNGKK